MPEGTAGHTVELLQRLKARLDTARSCSRTPLAWLAALGSHSNTPAGHSKELLQRLSGAAGQVQELLGWRSGMAGQVRELLPHASGTAGCAGEPRTAAAARPQPSCHRIYRGKTQKQKKRFKEQTLFLPNAINTELYKL